MNAFIGQTDSDLVTPAAGAVLLVPSVARAQTGLCDATPADTQACIDQIQNSGAVRNLVFQDINGRPGDMLPAYGVLFNQWGPTCVAADYSCGCSGTSYKFSGVIGEILADLALTGTSNYDLAFLSSQRFALAGR